MTNVDDPNTVFYDVSENNNSSSEACADDVSVGQQYFIGSGDYPSEGDSVFYKESFNPDRPVEDGWYRMFGSGQIVINVLNGVVVEKNLCTL